VLLPAGLVLDHLYPRAWPRPRHAAGAGGRRGLLCARAVHARARAASLQVPAARTVLHALRKQDGLVGLGASAEPALAAGHR